MHLIISSEAMTGRINIGYTRLHPLSHGDSRGGDDLFPDLVRDYPDKLRSRRRVALFASDMLSRFSGVQQPIVFATTLLSFAVALPALVVKAPVRAGRPQSDPRQQLPAFADNAESPVMQVEPDHVAKQRMPFSTAQSRLRVSPDGVVRP